MVDLITFFTPQILKFKVELQERRYKQILHPFQPFIIGQKTFALKMAAKFNTPLVFYGEMGGKGGKKNKLTDKSFNQTKNQKGFEIDPLLGKKFQDVYLGGKK